MSKEKLLFNLKTDLLGLFTCLAFVFTITFPDICKTAVSEGLSLVFGFLIPALFFHIIFTGIIKESGVLSRLHISHRWQIIILSLFGGFLAAASETKRALEKGEITKEEAVSINKCFLVGGPALLIGGVGLKLLKSPLLGLLLYFSNTLSCFLLYLFIRPKTKPKKINTKRPDAFSVLVIPVLNASKAFSILAVFTVLFSAAEFILLKLGFSPAFLLEITTSLFGVSKVINLPSLLLLAFLSSFGGISIQIQVVMNLREVFPKFLKYFLIRILSGTLSAFIFYILFSIFKITLPVSAFPSMLPDFSSGVPASLFLIVFSFSFSLFLSKMDFKRTI